MWFPASQEAKEGAAMLAKPGAHLWQAEKCYRVQRVAARERRCPPGRKSRKP